MDNGCVVNILTVPLHGYAFWPMNLSKCLSALCLRPQNTRFSPELRPKPEPKRRPKRRPGKRPTGYLLFGERTDVSTFVAIYVGVYEELHRRHANSFMAVVEPLWGNRRPWFAPSREVLRRGKRVPGSQLFAETNLSADGIHKRSIQLLQAFGYQTSDLQSFSTDPTTTGNTAPTTASAPSRACASRLCVRRSRKAAGPRRHMFRCHFDESFGSLRRARGWTRPFGCLLSGRRDAVARLQLGKELVGGRAFQQPVEHLGRNRETRRAVHERRHRFPRQLTVLPLH